MVATVLTACGIETIADLSQRTIICFKLQQYLPLAVLKLKALRQATLDANQLQQYLPRTVLNRILQPKTPSRLI